MRIIKQIAVCVATLGCSAVLAAGSGAANPAAPLATGSVPSNVGEPSAATPGVGSGTTTRAGVDSSATQQFVTQAAYANNAELQAARYALAHSHSADVKRFAQKMISDHTKANRQLSQITSRQGLTTPSALSDQDRIALMRLERIKGAQFDAAYATSEARDHGEVVATFKRAEQNPQIDRAERNFAEMTLPVLQDHLQMANQLVASHAEGNHSAG